MRLVAGSGKGGTTNQSYYLYKGSLHWSLSPYVFNNYSASVLSVLSSGYLDRTYVYESGAVAPVINLSADYVATLRGTGTMTDPYRASDVTS